MEKGKSIREKILTARSYDEALGIYEKACGPGCTASPRTLRRWKQALKRVGAVSQ